MRYEAIQSVPTQGLNNMVIGLLAKNNHEIELSY